MAESDLSIEYADLQKEVGNFLHLASDETTWDTDDTARVDRFIQSGIRQFYYPPAIEGVPAGYRWSFLRPVATIVTADGDRDYDLPDDFSFLSSDLFYDESQNFERSIVQVSESQMQELIQRTEDKGKPKFCATRFKSSDLTDGQRHEVLLWPVPNGEYTLTYQYEAYSGKIDKDSKKYPLGGMKYGECIIESCLSIAESRGNDEKGIHYQDFIRLLVAAVALDRDNSARRYGQMGDHEEFCNDFDRHLRQSTYPITYKGNTW